MQAVIDAGLIGPLVNLLQNAEFEIKKEAAWAISNATSGGTHEQIKYVVSSFVLNFPLYCCVPCFCVIESVVNSFLCIFHSVILFLCYKIGCELLFCILGTSPIRDV